MKWYWVLSIILVLIFGLAIYNRVYKKNVTPPKIIVDLLNGNLYNAVDGLVNGDSNNKI